MLRGIQWPPPAEVANVRAGLRMHQLKTSVRRRFEDAAPMAEYQGAEPDDKLRENRVMSLLTLAAENGRALSAPQIAAAANVDASNIHHVLKKLFRRRVIMVDGLSDLLGNNKPARLYRAVLPADGIEPKVSKNNFVRGLIMPLLINARDTGQPVSARELAAAAGCSLNGVKHRIAAMSDRHEIVIAGKRVDPHAGRKSGVTVSLYAAADWVNYAE
jgi:DNA-binding Lrp family transcriptional regulator